jgi:hypothetical protein
MRRFTIHFGGDKRYHMIPEKAFDTAIKQLSRSFGDDPEEIARAMRMIQIWEYETEFKGTYRL